MKKISRFFFATILLLLLNLGLLSNQSFGQIMPPPPPPPSGNTVGGYMASSGKAAPIEEGSWILLALAMGYGVHKFNSRKKNNLNQDEGVEEE